MTPTTAPTGSLFPGFGEGAGLDLPDLSPRVLSEVTARLRSGSFDAWAVTAERVGHCAKPIRLLGSSTTVDARTGEVLSTCSSTDQPLGVLHVPCGNRRASECPSCSRVYAADTFHLIRSGVTGGKGVPERVGENPLVFATLTAPSFGPVHGTRNGRACRPYATKSEGKTCEHGRPTTCHTTHDDHDDLLGQPLCADCYDYLGQIVWQWWAPELWRRFTIDLRRAIARNLGVTESRLTDLATFQYAKVAEYQTRGVIHFHALVRLDGPRTPEGFAAAPSGVTAAWLADVIETAVTSVHYRAPGLRDGDQERTLRFGAQVDTRPVTTRSRTDDPDDTLTGEQVAGYLAKYATKSATDAGAVDNPHLRHLRAVIGEVAMEVEEHTQHSGIDRTLVPYGLLGKWRHMLGFRGHFSSKSRRYSVTLGQLRRARVRYQRRLAQAAREGRTLDTRDLDDLLHADEDETTLVIGHWVYAGSGWDTEGEAELAKAAAARAREYAQWKAAQRKNHTNQPER